MNVSEQALEAADAAFIKAGGDAPRAAVLAALEAAQPFIVNAERHRIHRLIRDRINLLKPFRRQTHYGKGCTDGLDHADHYVLDKPHPADSRPVDEVNMRIGRGW